MNARLSVSSRLRWFVGFLFCIAVARSGAQVLTLAGYGGEGFQDGTNSAARFFQPQGLTADRGGNLYVADSANHTIRKIAPNGTVSTLAGTPGQSGTADGSGPGARFNHPIGLAFDSATNLYVADFGNHTIRLISPAGAVSTLAGMPGSSGIMNGVATNSLFNHPTGVAVDGAGNVYVADYGNNVIRRISSAGIVITLAGTGAAGTNNGLAQTAQFNLPFGLALDSGTNIYVTDSANHSLRKITASGQVSTLAGIPLSSGTNDGPLGVARFYGPQGLALDNAGDIFVGDYFTHIIRKVTAIGDVSTITGIGGVFGAADGTNTSARFRGPAGLAMSSGNLFVADSGNGTVRKLSASGTDWVVSTVAGSASIGAADGVGGVARFYSPGAIAMGSAGTLYVADALNSTIRRLNPTGFVSTVAGVAGFTGSLDGPATSALFSAPQGITVDSAQNIYVADTANSTIRKISGTTVTTIAGTAGVIGNLDTNGTAALFNRPEGVVVNSAGTIYVADTGNHTIRKIASGNVVTTLAGLSGSAGGADGTNAMARFNHPVGLALDAAGNVIVADCYNHTLRRVTPSGLVTTVAGLAGLWGASDGTNGSARFFQPRGVTLDSIGRIYVADAGNQLTRIVIPIGSDWVVSTMAGAHGISGSADGFRAVGRLNHPAGIAINGAGMTFIADSGNNAIRSVPPFLPPAAPGSLSAQAVNYFRIDLHWSDLSTNESGFAISRSLTSGGPYVDLPQIINANTTSFSDTNVEANTTYYYVVHALNDSGASLNSAQAFATTPPLPPTIVTQPQSQSVAVGQGASFSVGLSGSAPFTYQWRFNGNNISGGTGDRLVIPAASYGDIGAYSVAVTNAAGYAISSNAILAVLAIGASGDNSFGQIDIPFGATNAIALAAGAWHSLALMSDGGVLAWGNNYGGQCNVPATLTNAVAIAGGGYHSLAITEPGGVAAWGADNFGQATVPSGLSNVLGVAAGDWHSLALLDNGTVLAWGDNTFGQTNIPAGLAGVIAIAAGGNHCLALRSNGTVVAWGDNTDGEGSYVGESDVPAGLPSTQVIAAGAFHSLAVTSPTNIVGWGDNGMGQCNSPALTGIATVVAGSDFNIVLRTNGAAIGWGDNNSSPWAFAVTMSNIVSVAAGGQHALALLDNGMFRPRLFNMTRSESLLKLRVQSRPRKQYAFEVKTNFLTTNWTALVTNRGNGGLLQFSDPSANTSQRFYRVREF